MHEEKRRAYHQQGTAHGNQHSPAYPAASRNKAHRRRDNNGPKPAPSRDKADSRANHSRKVNSGKPQRGGKDGGHGPSSTQRSKDDQRSMAKCIHSRQAEH